MSVAIDIADPNTVGMIIKIMAAPQLLTVMVQQIIACHDLILAIAIQIIDPWEMTRVTFMLP
ncbi:hypothetical protein D3C84_976530 [compost metagenome]